MKFWSEWSERFTKGDGMTDFEISKALALAIGWNSADIVCSHDGKLICFNGPSFAGMFDYKDWSVIRPIAEKYNCFPWHLQNGMWCACSESVDADAVTPQKSIALALIGCAK